MAKKATTATNTDQKTMDLIALVAQQKAEISRAERPSWKTNCTFSYVEGPGAATNVIPLHVETDIRKLILMAAFLLDKQASYKEAATTLGVESPPAFQWCNSPAEDWLDDIRTRITKIQISSKRKRLEDLEARLTKIISPELRAKMELDAIASELT